MKRRDLLAAVGLGAATVVVPAATDYLAIKLDHETISGLIARGLNRPIVGPVVAGAAGGFTAGLAWHLIQCWARSDVAR